MGKDEKILLATAFVALVALLIAKFRDNAAPLFMGDSRAVNFRNFNTINWAAVGGVSSVIPQVSSGENGIPTNSASVPWASDCGCF